MPEFIVFHFAANCYELVCLGIGCKMTLVCPRRRNNVKLFSLGGSIHAYSISIMVSTLLSGAH